MSDLELDPIVAVTDLALRTGATSSEIGFLDDEDDPIESRDPMYPRWWIKVYFKTTKVSKTGKRVPAATTIIVENYRSPDEAADAMARKLLVGAECQHCLKPVTINDTPGCRWYRTKDRWMRGCE